MEAKHTKGQWYATEFAGRWMISDSNFYDGDDLLDTEDKGESEAEANAKLMATAPDMLEALIEAKRMYEELEPAGGWQGVYEQIESAINKATI